MDAGLRALHWLVQGYGHEITGLDVIAAYSNTMKAAEHAGTVAATRQVVRRIVSDGDSAGARRVRQLLGKELGLQAGR